MYMYMYIYIYTYSHIYICIYLYMYIIQYIFIYTHMLTYMYQELPMHHSTIGSPSTETTFEHEAFVVNLERRFSRPAKLPPGKRRGVWGSQPRVGPNLLNVCKKNGKSPCLLGKSWKIHENPLFQWPLR